MMASIHVSYKYISRYLYISINVMTHMVYTDEVHHAVVSRNQSWSPGIHAALKDVDTTRPSSIEPMTTVIRRLQHVKRGPLGSQVYLGISEINEQLITIRVWRGKKSGSNNSNLNAIICTCITIFILFRFVDKFARNLIICMYVCGVFLLYPLIGVHYSVSRATSKSFETR